MASKLVRAAEPERCAERITLAAHAGTTQHYALSPGAGQVKSGIVLVMLPGGGGHLDLDETGCPRELRGNSLVRFAPMFNAAGVATALLDAPSDHPGDDGLMGFRQSAEHAQDIGAVIADLRARGYAQVWLAGTSRGTISGANVAIRQSGKTAPDGVILTSILSVGQPNARKRWVEQSVFDMPLERIQLPLLLIGHASDTCVRSPASMMDRLAARAASVREQVVVVTGGAGSVKSGIDACEGRSPHGFFEQEAEVVAGMLRFMRGQAY